jgi:ferredoxin
MAQSTDETKAKSLDVDRVGRQGDRSFPTDGRIAPSQIGEAGGEERPLPRGEAATRRDGKRSHQAKVVGRRVVKGPTQADRDNLPYVQEAWEWAWKTIRRLGLRRWSRSLPCVLDLLTRMRMATLIEHRNLAWPATAATVAGLHRAQIIAEHEAWADEVDGYVARAGRLLEEGLNDGWDGVIWGDVDPDDPLRTLEIDRALCEDCGRCVVTCPRAFAKSHKGVVWVEHPAAVRARELEESCLEALAQCPRGAIRLNSRGGRTASGVLPPRGCPLPGEARG